MKLTGPVRKLTAGLGIFLPFVCTWARIAIRAHFCAALFSPRPVAGSQKNGPRSVNKERTGQTSLPFLKSGSLGHRCPLSSLRGESSRTCFHTAASDRNLSSACGRLAGQPHMWSSRYSPIFRLPRSTAGSDVQLWLLVNTTCNLKAKVKVRETVRFKPVHRLDLIDENFEPTFYHRSTVKSLIETFFLPATVSLGRIFGTLFANLFHLFDGIISIDRSCNNVKAKIDLI